MARLRGSQATSLPPRNDPFGAVVLSKQDFEQLKSHASLNGGSGAGVAGSLGSILAGNPDLGRPYGGVASGRPAEAHSLAPPPRRTRSASLKTRVSHAAVSAAMAAEAAGPSSAPSSATGARAAAAAAAAKIANARAPLPRAANNAAGARMERLEPEQKRAAVSSRPSEKKFDLRAVGGKLDLQLQGQDPRTIAKQPRPDPAAAQFGNMFVPGAFSAVPVSAAAVRGMNSPQSFAAGFGLGIGGIGLGAAGVLHVGSGGGGQVGGGGRHIYVGSGANVGLGLAISGSSQAASIVNVPLTSESPAPALSEDVKDADEWSSSEGESDGDDSAQADDGKSFDYRDYRYKELQATRGRAADQGQSAFRRRPPQPKRAASQLHMHHSRGADHDDCPSPWRTTVIPDFRGTCAATDPPLERRPPSRVASPRRNAGRPQSSSAARRSSERVPSRCSTPTPICEEEIAETESLRRVAEVIVQFYGLPGGIDRAVKLKHGHAINAVVVEEDAWVRRARAESQLELPPVVWLRGGRIYDFHGDRGTFEEFQTDLLVRGVEDDDVCRQRRRAQGLMPFPFVAAPIPQKNVEEEPEQPRGRQRPMY